MFLLYAYSIEIELNVNAREKIAKINCKTCKNSLKNVKKLEKKIEKRLMVVKTIEQKILP